MARSSIRISNQAHKGKTLRPNHYFNDEACYLHTFSLFNHLILAQIAARGVLKREKLLEQVPQIALFFIARQFKFVYRELVKPHK